MSAPTSSVTPSTPSPPITPSIPTTPAVATTAFAPDQHAIVEIMGHTKLAGRICEVAFAGTVLLRVDVPEIPAIPACERPATVNEVYSYGPRRRDEEGLTGRIVRDASPGRPAFTRCFGGQAIFSLTPCTAEQALADEMERWTDRPHEKFVLDEGQEASAALLPPPDDEDDDEHNEQPF